MHVQDITAGSGFAVSSLLAMGIAATFDVMKNGNAGDRRTVDGKEIIDMNGENEIKEQLPVMMPQVPALLVP